MPRDPSTLPIDDALLRQWASASLSGLFLLRAGCFQWVNAQFERDTGYQAADLLGIRGLDLVHPDDRLAVRAQARAMLRGERQTPYEYRYQTKDGDTRWALETLTPLPDLGPRTVLGSFLDITSRKQAEEQLAQLAFYDALTGLPNRALLMDLLDRALVRREWSKTEVAVLYLDLDDFKAVNDAYGHHVGDMVLTAVGKRLAPRLRRGDVLGRLGGDEFVAVVEQVTSGEDAKRVAERLKLAMRAPFRLLGERLKVRVSIGVALSTPATCAAQELLLPADGALYQAKRTRKGSFVLVEPQVGTSPSTGTSGQWLRLVPREAGQELSPGA